MGKSQPAVIDYACPGLRGPRWWKSRGLLLLMAAVAWAAIVLAYAGTNWAVVLYELLTDGVLAVVWAAAMVGIGSAILQIFNLKFSIFNFQLEGQPALRDVKTRNGESHAVRSNHALYLATAFATGAGVTSLLVLGMGLAGALNRMTAIAIVAVGVILLAVRGRKLLKSASSESIRASLGRSAGWEWLWLLVVPCFAIAVTAAMFLPGVLWGDEPNGYDVLSYHLQVPREWYEAGRIVPLHHNVFSFFPFGVETHFLLAMELNGGPWAGMYLAQFMHVGFCVFAVVAMYGVALAVGPQRSAILAAVLAANVPWITLLAPVAYNEGGLLLYGTLAIGWAMIGRGWKEIAVAGAMAGFACGVKYTGVPMLLMAVPVAMVIVRAFLPLPLKEGGGEGLEETRNAERGTRNENSQSLAPALSRRERGQAFAFAGVFVIVGVIVFSPWMIRNLVWAGNPVFPEAMRLLGQGHFSDVQVERWERAHAPREDQKNISARTKASWDQIFADWKFGFVIVPAGVIAVVLSRERRESVFLGLMLAMLLFFWIGFTHLQGRFFVLAIPICALATATVRWRKMIPLPLAVICIAAAISGSMMHEMILKQINRVGIAIGVIDTHVMWQVTHRYASPTMAAVGPADVFWCQSPMSQFWYRTVFDVDSTDASTPFEAWVRGWNLPPGVPIWEDPMEISRLSSTYWKIPRPTKDFSQQPTYLPAPPAPASEPSP